MSRFMVILAAAGALALGAVSSAPPAAAGGDHAGGHMDTGPMPRTLDEMREMHRQHQHGHDFSVIERMSPEDRASMISMMRDIGVAMPPMDAGRGRRLFVDKGCIACHSVAGVGGNLGPALDAADMPRPMNAFEFAARMWRGAQAMTALQEDLLGEVISLDGQDLADLVAFAHDEEEQARLTEDQIPERFHSLIGE